MSTYDDDSYVDDGGDYQIEMLWRCSACSGENRGRDKVCASCGKPKTDAEEFYMPGDTSPSAAVSDPELLRHATAGADWTCRYCGSARRRLDGSCEVCGAGKEERREREASGPAVASDVAEQPIQKRLLPALAVAAVAVALLGLWFIFRTRIVDASVASVSWEHKVIVDRYQVWRREGWDPDRGSFDVKDLGSRIHHYDQVLDHYDTEHYTVQVACGQSCYSTPRTCTSNKNGFASCSGGGQHCSTRYCSEGRTRQVARYRSEPRYRDWYVWNVWDWGENRVVRHAGNVFPTSWPGPDEVKLKANIGKGEDERSRRESKYGVKLADKEDSWDYEPKGEDEFQRFALGSKHRIKVGIAHGIEFLHE